MHNHIQSFSILYACMHARSVPKPKSKIYSRMGSSTWTRKSIQNAYQKRGSTHIPTWITFKNFKRQLTPKKYIFTMISARTISQMMIIHVCKTCGEPSTWRHWGTYMTCKWKLTHCSWQMSLKTTELWAGFRTLLHCSFTKLVSGVEVHISQVGDTAWCGHESKYR